MRCISSDQETIRFMIRLYCRKHLKQETPSEEYQQLTDYACLRLARCPFKEKKPTCKNCTIHCYAPEKRKMIQEVMRWAGPRMIFYAPKTAIRHMLQHSAKTKIAK